MDMTTGHFGGSLTEEQRNFYNTEGYLVLEDLLNEEDMIAPKEAMQMKVDAIADDLAVAGLITDKLEGRPFPYRLAELFRGLTAEDFLKFGRSWRDRLPGYFHLMSNPKIVDAVESLIGGEIFSNPVYNVRPKVPGVAAGAVPWHQDKSYWPDANANPVITVWVSIVDATLENGCLHLKPKTQHSRVLDWHQETYTGTGYTALHDHQVRPHKTVALPVKAGTAILFNDRLLHMSTPNLSDHVRWSVDLRYQPTDQDSMPQHGAGFLVRSHQFPDRVATLEDWMARRVERENATSA
ncbi:phytanoyl-CoA dioxygenase family protein [Paenibacillus terrigena]|uniref:phytanoyl-CoA dioxygenase family protein n=1 Tax=Paenibacillus terrigena TaxID=369333 RepID=UPI0028D57ACB|nr:phytanoyl-CoA dioxygenase family protein [Paenibacillus terrigena]